MGLFYCSWFLLLEYGKQDHVLEWGSHPIDISFPKPHFSEVVCWYNSYYAHEVKGLGEAVPKQDHETHRKIFKGSIFVPLWDSPFYTTVLVFKSPNYCTASSLAPSQSRFPLSNLDTWREHSSFCLNFLQASPSAALCHLVSAPMLMGTALSKVTKTS